MAIATYHPPQRHRPQGPRQHRLALGLLITLALCLGMLTYAIFDKPPLAVHPVHWSPQTQWMVPQQASYQLYARQTVQLPQAPEAAWLQVSGDQRFQLYVNGVLVTNSSTDLFDTLSDQTLANINQALNQSLPYRPWEDPANYQVPRPNNWKVVTYVDLCQYLKPGKNVIALVVENSRQRPRIAIQGNIYPIHDHATVIPLSTGQSDWYTTTMAANWRNLQWYQPNFPDQNWAPATWGGPLTKTTYSTINPRIFDRFLAGQWITGRLDDHEQVFLRTTWVLPQLAPSSRVFIRFAGTGNYSLLLNRQVINQTSGATGNALKMFDITQALQPGENELYVSLKRSLIADNTKTQEAPLKFYLDGWVETASGGRISPIQTDSSWDTLVPQRPTGETAQPTSAVQLGAVDAPKLRKSYEGDAYRLNVINHLIRQSFWFTVSLIGVSILAICFGSFWLGIQQDPWRQLVSGISLFFPATLFLVGMGLLKHRFALEETGLLFSQPNSHLLLFIGFGWILLLTLLLSLFSRRPEQAASPVSIHQRIVIGLCLILGLLASYAYGLAQYGYVISGISSTYWVLGALMGIPVCGVLFLVFRPQIPGLKSDLHFIRQWQGPILLLAIAALGAYLRLNHLADATMVPDEATSYDTAIHIVKTGLPLSTSGIWYTRSPVYHYMLAGWMHLWGTTHTSARELTVGWGVLSIIAMYGFAKQVSRNQNIALLMALIIAIDPWEITTSRIIRFYQPVQCLSLLAFILFFKGFVYREGRKYQNCFFVVLTLTLLCQEVTVVILPAFLIGFLFFYRPFNPIEGWNIIVGSAATMLVLMVDLIVFEFKCKTPFVALSTTTGSMIQPHFLNVADFTLSLLAGPSRIFVIYGLFFLLGFGYFLRSKNGILIFLFSSVMMAVLLLTLLVMEVRNRYLYPIYPLFLFVAIYSSIKIVWLVADYFQRNIQDILPLKYISIACLVLLLCSNLQIGNVFLGAIEPLYIKQDEAVHFIKDNLESEDLVMAASSQIAAITLDKVDYFLATGSLRFDIYYQVEGHVVDRWSQARLISNLDQLNRVLDRGQRVWIMLSDTDPFSPPAYQALRQYLDRIGTPMIDSYGVQVRLWDPEDASRPFVPNQGKDIGTY